MGRSFASGKHAIAECDRCGFRYKLKKLKQLTIKTKKVNILVCPECFETKHPQLEPITVQFEPQALHEPRTDRTEPIEILIGQKVFPSINKTILQGITFIGTVTVTT